MESKPAPDDETVTMEVRQEMSPEDGLPNNELIIEKEGRWKENKEGVLEFVESEESLDDIRESESQNEEKIASLKESIAEKYEGSKEVTKEKTREKARRERKDAIVEESFEKLSETEKQEYGEDEEEQIENYASELESLREKANADLENYDITITKDAFYQMVKEGYDFKNFSASKWNKIKNSLLYFGAAGVWGGMGIAAMITGGINIVGGGILVGISALAWDGWNNAEAIKIGTGRENHIERTEEGFKKIIKNAEKAFQRAIEQEIESNKK